MLKKSILSSFLIFSIAVLVGIIMGNFYLNDISWFDNEVRQLSHLDIFSHNFKSNIMNIMGIISFGFLTIIYLIINGFILGVTICKGGFYIFLTKIVPHGIFEVSSMILISSIGLLPIWIGIYKYKNMPINLNKNVAIKILKVISLSIILLFLAAVIESNIISGGI
ncbi:stage II sporulation protein M [Clostridium sp. LCP25S3_F8]|uniref:stage II sporulation protein M n=1 Tax=Clostridium sp. LCP25S3_F8 TaxID=3438751 RepID=UPI003F8F3BB6